MLVFINILNRNPPNIDRGGKINAVKGVAHIITTIERGGAEIQLLQVAKSLRNLKTEVSIVFLKGKPELYKDLDEIGCTILDLRDFSFVRQVLCFRRYLKENRDFVVHAHLPRSEIVASLATLFTKSKLVITRHNCEKFWPEFPKEISSLLSRIVLHRANRVIVISNAVFNYIKINREIGKNMFDRVQLVYYGFAKIRFNSSRDSDHSGVLKIGTISRLEKQKDLETLMRAVASLSPDTPICLKILGDGSQRDNLESLSKELSINEFTHFLGKTDQVNDFLFSTDVFVLTSKYEGFGAVLVEAMQAGVPIIATRVSSIPEVLGDHYPGLCEVGNYKEVANLILKCKTPSFTEICISGYEERLVKFSEDFMVQNLLSVYNEALAR